MIEYFSIIVHYKRISVCTKLTTGNAQRIGFIVIDSLSELNGIKWLCRMGIDNDSPYFVLWYHFDDFFDWDISSDDSKQISCTNIIRMISAVEYWCWYSCHQSPLPFIYVTDITAWAANKYRTPMNWMIGLIENHWTCHHQTIIDNPFSCIFRWIYLRIESCLQINY